MHSRSYAASSDRTMPAWPAMVRATLNAVPQFVGAMRHALRKNSAAAFHRSRMPIRKLRWIVGLTKTDRPLLHSTWMQTQSYIEPQLPRRHHVSVRAAFQKRPTVQSRAVDVHETTRAVKFTVTLDTPASLIQRYVTRRRRHHSGWTPHVPSDSTPILSVVVRPRR